MTWTEEGTHSIIKAKTVVEQGPHYEGDAVTVIVDKKHFGAQVNAVGTSKDIRALRTLGMCPMDRDTGYTYV